MATGRELISRVRSLNKLIDSDNVITDRAIFKELKATASLLIKRETNLRIVWNSPNIFSPIECIEMERVPLSECCDYQSPCEIAKSVKEIPQVSEGIFGLLVQTVYSPGLMSFNYASIDRYLNILKLGLGGNLTSKYYWFYNKHLYITNPDIEKINLVAYFDDDINPLDLNGCIDSSNSSTCINPLDQEFKIPSYLEKNLVDMVCDTLNKTYFRHIEDRTNDKKDDEKS